MQRIHDIEYHLAKQGTILNHVMHQQAEIPESGKLADASQKTKSSGMNPQSETRTKSTGLLHFTLCQLK